MLRIAYIQTFLDGLSHTHSRMHTLCFPLAVLFDCHGEVNRKMPDGKIGVHRVIKLYVIEYL